MMSRDGDIPLRIGLARELASDQSSADKSQDHYGGANSITHAEMDMTF